MPEQVPLTPGPDSDREQVGGAGAAGCVSRCGHCDWDLNGGGHQ